MKMQKWQFGLNYHALIADEPCQAATGQLVCWSVWQEYQLSGQVSHIHLSLIGHSPCLPILEQVNKTSQVRR